MLDAQEYLHLAIKSSQDGMHQSALEQLHHCLLIEPDNSVALFLLAAEHAELGMYSRAIEGMEKALLINPALEVALLQLGMLYARNGENDKAIAQWDKLHNATEDGSLKLFSAGLTLLCNSETAQAISLLQQGINENTANPALNQSITNIINSMPPVADDGQDDNKDALYLGAYSNSLIGES